MPNFMNPTSGRQVASCDWTVGCTNSWKDMMEPIVTFHSFVYIHENFIFQDCKMIWRVISSLSVSLSRPTFQSECY